MHSRIFVERSAKANAEIADSLLALANLGLVDADDLEALNATKLEKRPEIRELFFKEAVGLVLNSIIFHLTPDESPPEGFEFVELSEAIEKMTVAEVLDLVEGQNIPADVVLEYERSGKNRKSLIEALEG